MSTISFLGYKPVNRIGLGAMQLAGPGVTGRPRDRAEARTVLRRAIGLGVDHIDTAQFYGPDTVNELIREALYPYPRHLKLATKVGARRDAAGGWLPAATPAELREGVEDNLRTLRTDRIDLVNLRRHHAAPDVPLADQLGTLQELRQEGKLDMIGISNVPREVAEQALTQIDDLSQVQNAYSILDRRQEPVLDFCRERDIAFVPFFPLGSAFGGGPRALARDPAVARVAADWDATPAQIALAWLLARYDRMLPIPGTSSVAHLEENLAAAAIRLDDADLAALDGVGQVGDPTT